MIVVTGAAGFIGSNLIAGLNRLGRTDILAVDDLTDGKKFKNLVDCDIADYVDYADFIADLDEMGMGSFHDIEAIFHLGACSTTTEWDGRMMMKVNYEYSKTLLHFCLAENIQLIYASSAAVYGLGENFKETVENESPLNVYGYSKWLFDQYVRRLDLSQESQVVGLRYFNVYGPREDHKGSMASVAFHLMNQLKDSGKVKLFQGWDGYGDGEQLRDFVFVEDCVNVNLWLFENPHVSGIFNVGTGQAQPFNAIANNLLALHGAGELEYIPFPDHLKGAYQSFTEADISSLREAGYTKPFHTLEQGLQKYYQWKMGELRQGAALLSS